MSLGRAEALTLLREWFTKRSLVRCEFEFSRFAACLRARIIVLSPDRVALFSDDTFCELVIPLGADVTFAFGDFKTAPPDEAATYGRVLNVFFPTKDRPNDPDMIGFLEVKDSL